jgi:hypothetical protein
MKRQRAPHDLIEITGSFGHCLIERSLMQA